MTNGVKCLGDENTTNNYPISFASKNKFKIPSTLLVIGGACCVVFDTSSHTKGQATELCQLSPAQVSQTPLDCSSLFETP